MSASKAHVSRKAALSKGGDKPGFAKEPAKNRAQMLAAPANVPVEDQPVLRETDANTQPAPNLLLRMGVLVFLWCGSVRSSSTVTGRVKRIARLGSVDLCTEKMDAAAESGVPTACKPELAALTQSKASIRPSPSTLPGQ